jgi:hypothetical protein
MTASMKKSNRNGFSCKDRPDQERRLLPSKKAFLEKFWSACRTPTRPDNHRVIVISYRWINIREGYKSFLTHNLPSEEQGPAEPVMVESRVEDVVPVFRRQT